MQRAHEQQRRCAGIESSNAAGLHGAAEVVDDEGQAAPRRTVRRVGVERHDDLPSLAVHVDRDVLGHDALGEGDELLGDAAQHLARIRARRVDLREGHEHGRRTRHGRLHRRDEEVLLRLEVPQHRRRRHAEDGGDVGQRGSVEAFLSEHAPCGLEDLLAGDARWASHL